jgi:hypothetical protein
LVRRAACGVVLAVLLFRSRIRDNGKDLKIQGHEDSVKTELTRVGGLIRSLAATAVAVLALAHPAAPGSEPPKLQGQTLDDKAIVLPDAVAGKVTLLLVGASRQGGERTGIWKDHFLTSARIRTPPIT